MIYIYNRQLHTENTYTHEYMTEPITEYGLSVSLESSPRNPTTPNIPKPAMNTNSPSSVQHFLEAPIPIRNKRSFSDLMEEDSENEYKSVSPRVLFSDMENDFVRRVARRLDFSLLVLDDSNDFHLSPVVLADSISMSRDGSSIIVSTNEKEVCESNCNCSSCCVGQCGVCYTNLPLRANHMFTLCGHLFCVRCILKWWNSSTTCPICRAELYDADEDVAYGDDDGDVANEAGNNWMQGQENDEEHIDTAAAADNEAAHEYIISAIHTHVNQAILNNGEDDTSNDDNDDDDDNDDNDDDAHLENNGHQNRRIDIRNVTLFERYKYLDCEWLWSGSNNVTYSNPNIDDTLYSLSREEFQGLRENRDIAMTLFGRMRFRETLFHSEQFLGHVYHGTWVSKSDWSNIEQLHFISIYSENHSQIYEFIIRRGCATSPVFEVSMFGFIKGVSIQQIEEYDPTVHLDNDWENHMEYVFVAEVFTPTDFFVYEGGYRSYGGYNMDEGTLTTQQISIPFSHVRRLYRICSHERWDA